MSFYYKACVKSIKKNRKKILEIFRALHWLARRKEQEWDQVIRLLKQKEEKLLIAQRNKVLIKADTDHMISR